MKNAHNIASIPDEASLIPKSRQSIERLPIATAWQEIASAELWADFEAATSWLKMIPEPLVAGGPIRPTTLDALKRSAEADVRKLERALHDLLISRLASGDLVATGRPGRPLADERTIPAAAWQYLAIYDAQRSAVVEDCPNGSIIFDVRISTRAGDCGEPDMGLATRAVAVVETKISDVHGCKRWLLQQMRASPNQRTLPKRECLERARQEFPTLSERQFNRVWADAVIETGATAWAAAGAPKKAASR